MKNVLLLLAFSLFTFTFSQAQIVVDFENTELGDTSFVAGGFEWKMTEDLVIDQFENFSCVGAGGFNRYMDSGYLDGGSEGVLGSIAPIDPEVFFEMYTAGSQCIWIANTDGEFTSTGTIRFTGLKMDNTFIEESFEVTSSNFNDLISVDLSPSIWEGVELTSLQFEITATQDSTNYFVIDNLTFESIAIPTSTEELDEPQISISPNPTAGMIQVATELPALVDVMDLTGKAIRQNISSEYSIDLSSLPAGIYFIKVKIDEYQKIEKIVKN